MHQTYSIDGAVETNGGACRSKEAPMHFDIFDYFFVVFLQFYPLFCVASSEEM